MQAVEKALEIEVDMLENPQNRGREISNFKHSRTKDHQLKNTQPKDWKYGIQYDSSSKECKLRLGTGI